ncbi:Uncharacterised protein [Serratia proteamaculans]|uniref:hypothetical protein n=1 Tax=Serratia proteamaculans TaxID=28151 RepID=UPI002178D357|nr:hypothetical protein [Serratia proteamaculans]CAI0723508.1 Uncharacterised protein [Serratia proteamaculans]CAI1519791.1 Uncharacterised protein [Serratia proteamaculans]
MGSKELGYQVVYRGETLPYFVDGGWVFFQRLKEYGGGYWLGRTYHNVFIIEYERPTSLFMGIQFIFESNSAEKNSHHFDDDFTLT